MIERKYFSFLTFKVVVELREDVPEGFNEVAAAGCHDEPDDKGRFRLWFSFKEDIPSFGTIAHESWHLFMTIMYYIDKFDHSFEELNSEMYAYNFHILFSTILDIVLGSDTAKKRLETLEEEN